MAKRITRLLNQFMTTVGARDGFFNSGPKLENTFDTASEHLQNMLLGYVQDYRVGSPNPPVQSQASLDVVMLLRPFKRVTTSNLLPQQLFRLTPPAGTSIAKIEAVWANNEKGKRIVFPAENRLASYLDNPNRLPTDTNPIGESVDDEYFKIYPSSITQAAFKFYLNPTPSNIVLDDEGNVDDALTSEMQWSDRAIPFLHWKMCELVGVQVSSPMLIQTGVQESNRSI